VRDGIRSIAGGGNGDAGGSGAIYRGRLETVTERPERELAIVGSCNTRPGLNRGGLALLA